MSETITGKLIRAGTMQISTREHNLEVVTGLLIELTIDELRDLKTLPMYRRVEISVCENETKTHETK